MSRPTSPWRPASGHSKVNEKTGYADTLWRVVRDQEPTATEGTFEELKTRNGRLWLHPSYETAKRKAKLMNEGANNAQS